MRSLYIYLLLALSYSLSAAAMDDDRIREPVTELHNALLNNMQTGQDEAYKERYGKLESVILERFDTALIAKVILGRQWKSLDVRSRKDFIALFNRLMITTYVNRFNRYDGETFEITSIEPMKKNRYLVKSRVTRIQDEPVSLDYIVHETGGNWKIISVIANGVNDLSLKRAEYTVVIKENGYTGLTANIESKIRELTMP